MEHPLFGLVPPQAAVPEADAMEAVPDDRYNLSNDRFYQTSASSMASAKLGQVSVKHARPAVLLAEPFFAPMMSDAELRSFHRPELTVTPLKVYPIRICSVRPQVRSAGDPRQSFRKRKVRRWLLLYCCVECFFGGGVGGWRLVGW